MNDRPGPAIEVLPMGRSAVLVEVDGDPAAFAAGVRRRCDAQGRAIVDVVPAARTVLITCGTRDELDALVDDLDAVVPVVERQEGSAVEIPVRYDGDDLAEIARRTGLGVDEVVALHHGASYRAAFCGFAPGFAYLDGLPEPLHLARRDTPRTSVPAGSVAIAVGQSAVYPRSSPGGWHLIGRTELAMFDPERRPPAFVTPGTTVRFVPT